MNDIDTRATARVLRSSWTWGGRVMILRLGINPRVRHVTGGRMKTIIGRRTTNRELKVSFKVFWPIGELCGARF